MGCWGALGAGARERWGSGVLRRAGHGGGEVAAVWGSGVRGRDGEAPARGEKGGEELGRDVWVATTSRRWPVALRGCGRCPSTPAAERNREAERWEMKSGLICNFQKV